MRAVGTLVRASESAFVHCCLYVVTRKMFLSKGFLADFLVLLSCVSL